MVPERPHLDATIKLLRVILPATLGAEVVQEEVTFMSGPEELLHLLHGIAVEFLETLRRAVHCDDARANIF